MQKLALFLATISIVLSAICFHNIKRCVKAINSMSYEPTYPVTKEQFDIVVGGDCKLHYRVEVMLKGTPDQKTDLIEIFKEKLLKIKRIDEMAMVEQMLLSSRLEKGAVPVSIVLIKL